MLAFIIFVITEKGAANHGWKIQTGLYALDRHSHPGKTGILNVIISFEFLLPITRLPLTLAVTYSAVHNLDTLATEPSVGLVLTLFLAAIGWFLFGLASLQAKVLPTGSAWLVVIGAFLALVLNIMQLPFSWVIFDVGVIWMGWWLWSEKITEQRTAPIFTV